MTNENEITFFDECNLSEEDRDKLLYAIEDIKPLLSYKSSAKIYHNGNLISKSNFMKSLYEQLKKEFKL